MKKIAISCLASLLCLFATAETNSQTPGINSPPTRSDIIRDNLEDRMNTMRNNGSLSRQTPEQLREYARTKYYSPVKSEELLEALEIDPALTAGFQNFLQTPNTGVFKFLPLPDCSKLRNLKKLEECYQDNANIREFANAFSFREGEMTVFARADLATNKGYILTGRHSVQTILVNLGDVPLEDLTLNSAGISYLTNFKPAAYAKQMDEEFDMFNNGVTVGDYRDGKIAGSYTYGKVTRIEENRTYALRSIAYRPESATLLGKDRDIVVVFRILDADKDGAVTILWKELNRTDGMVMKYADENVPATPAEDN
jgi:hypothetical protein